MAKQQWGYKYRTFGGEKYRIGTWHNSKKGAQNKAEYLRKRGYKVRVVPQRSEGNLLYVIYAK